MSYWLLSALQALRRCAATRPPKTFTRSAWDRGAHDDFKTSRGNEP